MALPLETTIMNEIGLGAHFSYYNGSGSCEHIRQQAAQKLASAIQKHHDAGEAIVPSDPTLMGIMQRATRWDPDRYTLTAAWQVASNVIAAHIHAHHDEGELQRMANYLRNDYRRP